MFFNYIFLDKLTGCVLLVLRSWLRTGDIYVGYSIPSKDRRESHVLRQTQKSGEGVTAQELPSSSEHISELGYPTQKSPHVTSRRDLNINKLN
ncbi:hypothetical protein AVEN_195772-1 [Araneus ventricosus]|uniref:Uncharacterized protein n=1 Tax=Araneus ventricosus TaxID=182803 RepID=A0A4Y2ISI6_ARAVE|nr:hypothetical protein AVEN_195772-1 [Araneus ventricosus]